MVPMVPDIISSPECLESELYPNDSDLVIAKLLSALPNSKLTRLTLVKY
jgi:hypothetical protein